MAGLKEKVVEFKDTVVNNPSFTVREQLGYAGGIFGNCMGQDSIGTFSDKFFRKFMKIEANDLTLMGNIQLVLGLIASTFAGNILDRPVSPDKKTPTKIITGITPIPFAITSMLLYIVPTGSPAKNFIWTLIFNLIFSVVVPQEQRIMQSVNTVAKSLKNFIFKPPLRPIGNLVENINNQRLNTTG